METAAPSAPAAITLTVSCAINLRLGLPPTRMACSHRNVRAGSAMPRSILSAAGLTLPSLALGTGRQGAGMAVLLEQARASDRDKEPGPTAAPQDNDASPAILAGVEASAGAATMDPGSTRRSPRPGPAPVRTTAAMIFDCAFLPQTSGGQQIRGLDYLSLPHGSSGNLSSGPEETDHAYRYYPRHHRR